MDENIKVRLILKDGSIETGTTLFSPGRHKKHSVNIKFDKLLKVTTTWDKGESSRSFDRMSISQEFYLRGKDAGQIVVWGQGIEYGNDSIMLHPEDLAEIAKIGG